MTDQEWLDLWNEYRAVFNSNIPLTQLPSDESAAVALIRKAIETGDEAVLDPDIPADAVI